MNTSADRLSTSTAFCVTGTMASYENVISFDQIEGTADVKARVSCALGADPAEVAIVKFGYSPSRIAARCTGNWKGRRFFAKMFLADLHPVPARFSAPWEVPRSEPEPTRAVEDQIETEWYMTHKMYQLSRGRCVPAPLGKSIRTRTVVWEEAEGVPLIRLIKRSRWRRSVESSGARWLFRAGSWLKNIHRESQQGVETIDLRNLINLARDFSQQECAKASAYDRVVPKVLETALPEIGSTGIFHVPVALTHGDFCLSNLIGTSADQNLAVIDFELSGIRPIYHDLFALTYELRSQFLNPIIPKAVIRSWEESFWAGYGSVSSEIRVFVKTLALARIFYYDFFRLLTRRQRKGWIAGMNGQLYRTFLEPLILTRRLELPRGFCSS